MLEIMRAAEFAGTQRAGGSADWEVLEAKIDVAQAFTRGLQNLGGSWNPECGEATRELLSQTGPENILEQTQAVLALLGEATKARGSAADEAQADEAPGTGEAFEAQEELQAMTSQLSGSPGHDSGSQELGLEPHPSRTGWLGRTEGGWAAGPSVEGILGSRNEDTLEDHGLMGIASPGPGPDGWIAG
jgi:hypothetical protein